LVLQTLVRRKSVLRNVPKARKELLVSRVNKVFKESRAFRAKREHKVSLANKVRRV